jgi:hypothetical protein
MTKVIALHLIQRKTKGKFESIQPGTLFNVDGQEETELRANGAIKDAPADKPVSEPADDGKGGKGNKSSKTDGGPLAGLGGDPLNGDNGHELIG